MARPPGTPAHGPTHVSLAIIPTPAAGRKVRKAARRRSFSNRSRIGCFAIDESLLPSPFSLLPSILRLLRETGRWRFPVKKFLGIFALLGALVGAVMFWRKQQDDDEFLDEELE